MPPRLPHLRGASRALTLRTRPSITIPISARIARPVQPQRWYADEKKPADKATGTNQDGLGGVSEEAADMGEVMGETKPDIGQGTPVQEILERDDAGKENAPEVIKEEMDTPTPSTTASSDNNPSLSVSNTSSSSNDLASIEDDGEPSIEHLIAMADMEAIIQARKGHDRPGLKFDLPSLPIPSQNNMKHRYEPVVDQVTNLIMRHGKLGVAQRNMSHILNHLRTAPPPVPSPTRPLLPGSPPPTHLPLNPTLYLTLAIDSVAPLVRIRSQKGAAGGGVALQIPVPLGLRQRRRTAVQWILDAAGKKKNRGSGKMMFAQRVAEEIVGVVEGRSSAWEKRAGVHRIGTSARANLNFRPMKKRM